MAAEDAESMPPRKSVTAWEVEPMEENGDEFFVLTFHHGLGKMTRLDLDAEDLHDLGRALTDATATARNDGPTDPSK